MIYRLRHRTTYKYGNTVTFALRNEIYEIYE